MELLYIELYATVINPDRIGAVEHFRLVRLPVADTVASGFLSALNVNRYCENEPSCLAHLKKTIYRHKAASLGYGLKLWPEDFATVKAKALKAVNFEGL